MPMKRSRYPQNWEQIALSVKQAANWTCEECSRPCRQPSESDEDLIQRIEEHHPGWAKDLREFVECDLHGRTEKRKLVRFTLTTAHPNHDPENPNAELRAWCSVCHCRYDLKAMRLKRQLELQKRGQLRLEGV